MNTTSSLIVERMGSLWRGSGTTYRFLFKGIVIIWSLGFVVGAFAPTTVLADHWVLQQYVSAMSFVANPRELIATKSTYPEVSALYHAVIFWSLPLWFLVWWKWMNSQLGLNKTDMIFKARLSFGNRLTLLVLLPLWVFLTFAGFNLNHGGDTRMIAFGTSRIQLAMFGMAFQLGVAGTLALALFSIKRLFTFNKTGDKK
jgi:hypothetical protein